MGITNESFENILPSVGTCQDRTYGAIVTTKRFITEASNNTYTMIVQGKHLGKEMDNFVQTRSHWMIDTMGEKGYEALRSFADTERLALQKELDRLQHRCVRFFNGAVGFNGFGSNWHNLGLGLSYGLHYNMTLSPPHKFENFIPMTTCTYKEMERAFNEHSPELEYSRWNVSTVNFKSLREDVMLLMENVTIIRPEFQHKGHFWWRSMLTYYAVRPNFRMGKLIRQSAVVKTPCISIHVRHSDNFSEAKPIAFPEYMKQAALMRNRTGISNIYLMTDDEHVIKSTKHYPDFQLRYMNVTRSNKGWAVDRGKGLSMDYQERTFLVDLFSAVQCQHSIVTYSSNVGRLIAEVGYAIRNKEPDVVSMDMEWMMQP
ncbi:hypothetical protein BGZ54_002536 [Gamsiella multidivaricata]|nr:hypothetical protein BGZ54_002536 [Gamsiella multidivaricata]